MSNTFILKIYRGMPGNQYWEEFELNLKPYYNIISALMDIQKTPINRKGKKCSPSPGNKDVSKKSAALAPCSSMGGRAKDARLSSTPPARITLRHRQARSDDKISSGPRSRRRPRSCLNISSASAAGSRLTALR